MNPSNLVKEDNPAIVSLWNKLSDFVYSTCRDRDPTHGHEHMKTVANHAMSILKSMGISDPRTVKLTLITAWVHDVADHKYDTDGKLSAQLDDFLINLVHNEDAELIRLIINHTSFSKEDKMRKTNPNWAIDRLKVLGLDGLLIRDIVSDADKLEAIGIQGLIRCAEFCKEKGIQEDKIIAAVRSHCDEKLLRLYSGFIVTEPGRLLAKPLHDEMVELLKLSDQELVGKLQSDIKK